MNSVAKMIVAFCVSLLLVSDVSVADKNQTVLQVEETRIHLAKGGGGWIKVSSVVWDVSPDGSAGKDFDVSDYDILAEYGVKNPKTTTAKIDNRRMRVVTRAELTDILQFVRILDSSSPFVLWHENTFSIRWDGKVFKLQMKYEHDDVATTALKEPDPPTVPIETMPPTVQITTDGRFTENSTGQVSENRSKIIIKSEQKELLLEIEELGVN